MAMTAMARISRLRRAVSRALIPAMMMVEAGGAKVALAGLTAVAAGMAATAFDDANLRAANAKGAVPVLRESGRIERDVARFYGAVGDTLCATLWDPGSSINMITPAFADELSKR